MKKAVILSALLLSMPLAYAQLIAPTLNSPENDITGASTRQTFSWYKLSDATGYTFQLDTSSAFNSPLLYEASQSNDIYYSAQSRVVYNLRYGTTYHWRVRAYNSTDTSDWSVVRTLTTTDQVSLKAPNNNITGSYTRVIFEWYNSRGSKGYILEVDSAADFSSSLLQTFTVYADSSNTSDYFYRYVYNLRYGTTYHWRVKAYNRVDTSEWSAVRTLTTTDQVSLKAPNDNNTGSYTKATFEWYISRGSRGYLLEVDTAASFTSPSLRTFTSYVDSSSTSEYFYRCVYNLHFGTTYHWRVKAYNRVDTSDWSAVRTLTTTDHVSLHSPTNNSSNCSATNCSLYWHNSRGCTEYTIQVDTSATFDSPLLQNMTTTVDATNTNSYIIRTAGILRYGTNYHWRVRAINEADTSGWSDTWHFTTTYDITTGPTLTTPANDSVGVDYNIPTLVWQAMDNMQGYHYEVSTHSSFDTLVAAGNTTLTFTALLTAIPSTTYYWRVRGYNAQGNTPYSATWHFTTADVLLTAPVHSAPADGVNTPADIDLAWHPVFGAVTYDLQLSLDNAFSGAVTNFNTADTHHVVSGLPVPMTFYWRVRANNGNTVSEWSSPWSFTTTNCTAVTDTIVHEMCDGESYEFLGTPCTTGGTYSHTLTTSQGCDSVVVLLLTVFNTAATDIYDTASGSYDWNGATYSASGDYTQTFSTVHGCDSTVTLHLSVTVGIDDAAGNPIQIHTQGDRIVIVGALDETAHVYDMTGRHVATLSADEAVRVPTGVYMVKIGSRPARKVVVIK